MGNTGASYWLFHSWLACSPVRHFQNFANSKKFSPVDGRGPHMCCVKQQLSRSLPLLAVMCLALSNHLKLLLTPVVAKTRLYASLQLPCRCSGAVRRACIFINKPSEWIIHWIYHSPPSGDSLKVELPPFLFSFKKCICAKIIVTFCCFCHMSVLEQMCLVMISPKTVFTTCFRVTSLKNRLLQEGKYWAQRLL